ncbi:MAG: hypothetical protein E7429_04860 [Ruminococcaceae bacterium]|nr:hypothetical protein [Oscillospiraceae bacterium]
MEFSLKQDIDDGNFLMYLDGFQKTYTMSVGGAASATINGALPTIDEVSLASSAVTVEGGNAAAQTVQASAVSVKGTDITNDVTWSVVPADQGVTISESGLVSVDANAQADSYTITATAKDGVSQGDAKTAQLTVTRAAEQVSSIAISGNQTVTINGKLDASKPTVTLTATVLNQYGDAYSGAVTWTSSNEDVATVAGGVVTVEDSSAADGTQVTITAAAGGMSAEHAITLNRAEAEAYEITTETTNLVIPLDDTDNEYTFTLKDQFGDKIETNKWKLNGSVAGVGIDHTNGKLWVSKDAESGTKFKVTLSDMESMQSVELTLHKAAMVDDSWGTPTTSTTYGDATWGELFEAVTGKTTASITAVETGEVTGTYTIDMNGSKYPVVSGSPYNVTATFTIADGQQVGGVDLSGVAFTKTFQVTVDKKPITIAMDDKTKEYGAADPEWTWTVPANALVGNDAENVISVTPALNGTSITGTAAADNYAVTVTPGTFTVTKRTLTVSAGNDLVVTKTYDGTTSAGAVSGTLILNNVFGTDIVSVVYTDITAGVYPAADVDTGMAVTLNGIAIVGADAENYQLSSTTLTANVGAIIAKNIADTEVVVADIPAQNYKNAQIRPELTVTYAGMTLDGEDYTVAYGANKDCVDGEQDGSVSITGKGNYTGTKTVYFDIVPTTTTLKIKDSYGANAEYDMTPIAEPTADEVECNIEGVTVNFTYYADAEGNQAIAAPVNAGTYYVKASVQAGTNYTAVDSALKQFTVAPRDINEAAAAVSDQTYSGEALTPAVSVVDFDGASPLVDAADFTVEYSDNTNAGTAKATVIGKGNYTGSKVVEFEIAPLDITATMNVVVAGGSTYTGTEQKPAVTVTAGETTLVDGTDYELTYSNNIDAGDATVTVTCRGNYVGMATEDFNIAKAALTLDTVTVAEKDYNGKVDDVNITAVVFAGLQNGETLTLGTDFTLSNVIYTSPNANESAEVTGTIALADTDKANNYELDAGAFLTTGKVDKAALSVTAKDHTIVYGDAPANSGVDYAGFVNGETTSVLGGELAYDYAYAQYGDVGAYAITPKGLTSENYDITFLPGELTVEQKEVALTWTGTGTQYYNGTEKTVTAAVADGYLVNGDEVAVTVTGGKQTNVGTYVAVATALTGAKAGNYKLPAEGSADFEIVDIRSASVTFTLYNGTTQTVEYAAEDLMTQLPVDSRPGYRFAGWKFKGNGVEIDNQTYTRLTDALLTALDAAAEPLTAEPRFASIPSSTKQNYTIKASAGEGGTISPEGAVTVAKGESVTFTFTPEVGYRVKTVKVDQKVVTADSSYTFETVKSNHTIEVTYEKIQYVNPFSDVDAGKYYYDAVLWAVEKGITRGTTDTTFEPTAICNRGQMVTFLWRAAGEPEPKTTENPFADVSADAYYYKAVLWAAENGITNGLTATCFGPAQACTRGQMAAFLWRAGGKQAPAGTTSAFTDVDAGKYYYDAVLWAAERGITLGKTATTFAPAEACNRGQMVTFLYRNALAK